MAQVINTNTMSLNTQRNLNTNGASLATSIQRLSSGLRINSAKDDAAGLAISQRMTTQIRGMDVAARNANDGISLAQTAEGALSSIGENLQRIRELAVQAANGTNSDDDKAALQKEVTALQSEILRVVDSTEFNGTKLLDGSASGAISIQVGANATGDDKIDITLNDIKTALSGVTASGFSVSAMAAGSGASQLTTLTSALKSVNEARADLGAVQNRFTSVINNLQTNSENLSASRSRIQDTDYAKETAELTRTQILQQAGTAMLAQAKSLPQSVLSLLQ
ncbi:MAG: flagellin [Pseudoxanthomonas sp.]